MQKKWDGLYWPQKAFVREANLRDKKIYKEAQKDPQEFWADLAKSLKWQKPFEKSFEHNPPFVKWFLGGKINITENIFGSSLTSLIADKPALIWEPEDPSQPAIKLTYGQLFEKTNQLSNALKKLGVQKGDRVGIYLPMIPEVIISMLACARIGAVHSVVFSAFSSKALQARLEDTGAKILITADGYWRRGKVVDLKQNADQAVSGTEVEKIIVVKRAGNDIFWQQGRDLWFDEITSKEDSICPSELINSEDPLFILYTSGSTGKPKGILHTCGGYAVQAKFTGKWIFDYKDNDIFWCTADIGWVTGHSYACYSPLLNGITTLIYEGAPDFPGPDRWAKIIEKHKATIFYTAPTAIRMFERNGSEAIKNCDFSSLRLLGSVGEPIDESAWNWYFEQVGKKKCPIVDTWWQTETGGILITSLPGIGPFKPAHTGLPLPGMNFDILDDNGKSCKKGVEGNLVLKPPFTPGLLRGVYNNPEKYKETYWNLYGDKIYVTSDRAVMDKKGLIRIVGRLDDVIKVAGHRITTGELEASVNSHQEINESAVIGVADEIKGEVPVVFAVYNGARNQEKIKNEVLQEIRKSIGPIAMPKEIFLVPDLPKTRSGKIMRRILKKLFTGQELGDLSTLSNPEIVEKIKQQITV